MPAVPVIAPPAIPGTGSKRWVAVEIVYVKVSVEVVPMKTVNATKGVVMEAAAVEAVSVKTAGIVKTAPMKTAHAVRPAPMEAAAAVASTSVSAATSLN